MLLLAFRIDFIVYCYGIEHLLFVWRCHCTRFIHLLTHLVKASHLVQCVYTTQHISISSINSYKDGAQKMLWGVCINSLNSHAVLAWRYGSISWLPKHTYALGNVLYQSCSTNLACAISHWGLSSSGVFSW